MYTYICVCVCVYVCMYILSRKKQNSVTLEL